MIRKFTSRKFLLALAGFILVILNDVFEFGIDPTAFNSAVALLITWIAAEGTRDAVLAFRTGK